MSVSRMPLKHGRVAVMVNPHKEFAPLRELIEERLGRSGLALRMFLVPLEGEKTVPAPEDLEVDFIITLGGDGTLLYAARFFYGIGVPVLAVNLGTFGFMTEISRKEVLDSIDALIEGRVVIQERIMLRAEVQREGKMLGPFHPLNEVVIGRKGISRLVTLSTSVNGDFLCTWRADGMLVSTPTGSTGYSLSANGPILLPGLSNLILNPICPHSLASRPVILSGDDRVSIEVSGSGISPYLSVDVQEGIDIHCGDIIHVRRASRPLRLVLSGKRSFFQVMREKLGWVNH